MGWVKSAKIDAMATGSRTKGIKGCVHPSTVPEDLHYRASRSCQRLFITRGPYIHRGCPSGSLRRLSRKGTLGENPPISLIPPRHHRCTTLSKRERPGRKRGIVFAINSSREQHGSKIDDTLPKSNKRTPVHEGPLMELDRVVILLINSSDMSAVEAAGNARRSPTEPRAGSPTGMVERACDTPYGGPPRASARQLLEKNKYMTKIRLLTLEWKRLQSQLC